jgi:hypothetical protein
VGGPIPYTSRAISLGRAKAPPAPNAAATELFYGISR